METTGTDGLSRCRWVNPANPAYVRYHDTEWGVPVHDDRRLFEQLVLETFQAGLSWECILGKREHFREAFSGFDPEAVSRYDEARIEALAADPGIIRHRGKIHAAVGNARVFLEIARECGSFDAWLWGWTGGKTLRETGKTTSALSAAVSKELRRRGMKFVGSTTVYAYLQAVGILDGHDPDCFCAQRN